MSAALIFLPCRWNMAASFFFYSLIPCQARIRAPHVLTHTHIHTSSIILNKTLRNLKIQYTTQIQSPFSQFPGLLFFLISWKAHTTLLFLCLAAESFLPGSFWNDYNFPIPIWQLPSPPMWHSFTSYSFYSVFLCLFSLLFTAPPFLILLSFIFSVLWFMLPIGLFAEEHFIGMKKTTKNEMFQCFSFPPFSFSFYFLTCSSPPPSCAVCFPFNLLLRFCPPPHLFPSCFGRCRILRECWVATLDSDEGHVGLKREKRRRGVMSDGGGWSCLHTRETDKAALIILMSLWEKSWHSVFCTHNYTYKHMQNNNKKEIHQF